LSSDWSELDVGSAVTSNAPKQEHACAVIESCPVFKNLLNTSFTEKTIQLELRMLYLKISPGVATKELYIEGVFF
jgi:hypothetical protein